MALSGARLRELREHKNLTQDELAGRVGISLRLLQKYESGDVDPSLDNATRLAEELDTSVDYLAGMAVDPVPGSPANLSPIERLVITLMRRGKLSQQVEAALKEALDEDLNEPPVSQKKTGKNR